MGPFLVAVLATFTLLGLGTWGFVRAGERRHQRRVARLERAAAPLPLRSADGEAAATLAPIDDPMAALTAATRLHLVTLEVLLEHARAMTRVESIVIDAQRRPLWVRLAAADLDVDVRAADQAARAWSQTWTQTWSQTWSQTGSQSGSQSGSQHPNSLTTRLAERGLDLDAAIPPDLTRATVDDLTARREWLRSLAAILASMDDERSPRAYR